MIWRAPPTSAAILICSRNVTTNVTDRLQFQEMQTADVVRMARQRAGLTQQQLAVRAGHPRETIARWETGAREPSLSSLRGVVGACGLDLVVSIANEDRSLADLVADQLELPPRGRVRALLPAAAAGQTLDALSWLAAAGTPHVVVGSVAAALQGAPQRPAELVEVVAHDVVAFTDELDAAGFKAQDNTERYFGSDRRWIWRDPRRGPIAIASGLPGAGDFRDLRRAARWLPLGGRAKVRVAHPRDLMRIAEASTNDAQRSRIPGLRALLDAESSETR